MQQLIAQVEQGRIPDLLVRAGIRQLLRQRLKEEGGDVETVNERLFALIESMDESPLALSTDTANEQHYELPAPFFEACLGRHLKYSCCHWPDGVSSLDAAEKAMLELTCRRAQLDNGQDILELGCGWGSLSLWMAEQYPESRITAVSNSASQRDFIMTRCEARGLRNLEIITCDMNDFATDKAFDRVVSLEMFEHMRNYRDLMGRVCGWLRPGGRLFVHIFCHRELAYVFQTEGDDNWMGRHFFTDGLMPSDNLLLHFQDDLQLTRRWRVNGRHYEKTCNAWLENMDRHRDSLMPVFHQTYGEDAPAWFNRWRVFHMACAELFGFRGGNEWYVSHYLFQRPEEQP